VNEVDRPTLVRIGDDGHVIAANVANPTLAARPQLQRKIAIYAIDAFLIRNDPFAA